MEDFKDLAILKRLVRAVNELPPERRPWAVKYVSDYVFADQLKRNTEGKAEKECTPE